MRSVRLCAAVVATLSPLLAGLSMATLGRATSTLLLAGYLDESKLPWLTRFFLLHGRVWIFPMAALALLVLLLSLWIHRAPRDESWKRGAMLWVVTGSLGLVLMVFGGAVMSWFLHVMLRAERDLFSHFQGLLVTLPF